LRRARSAFGLTHGAHFSAAGATAIKNAGAISLEAADGDAGRHFKALEDFARLGGNVADFALLRFEGGMPEFAVDPGDAGDEPVRFDRAQDSAGVGVDLMDLACAVLTDPEGAFGPGESRVAAVSGGRD